MRRVIIALLVIAFSNVALAQDEKKGSPDLPGDLIVNLGINTLTNRPENMRVSAFGSKSFGIYYTNRIQLSPSFSFYPGIGITSEKYEFEEDVTLIRNADNETVVSDITDLGEIDKNRIAVNYLEVPLEFRYYPWKTNDGSGFFIGVGGSLGVRVESHMKLKYSDGDVNFKNKFSNDFNLSSVRYGLIGRVGTRGISGFYRIYFSELFDAGQSPDPELNPTSYTIGISINAF